MLNSIISYSVRNKLIIGLFVLALIVWGIFEVTRLPIDAVPDITDNQVQVITVSPALGATDVERLITFPIEQACSSTPGLKNIRSFSRFGLSLVTVVFNDDVDVYWARQQINERLQQVKQNIPEGIGSPEMAPVTTGLGEIYQYVVRPKPGFESKYDAMALRTIQDGIIRRQLLGTYGVADVSSFGGLLKQYEIGVKTEQLKSYNLTVADIFTALENNNENTGGAYIEKGPTVLYIRTEGLTKSMEDIEKIVVNVLPNGMPVLIRDVATVGIGSATRYGAMCYNDQGEVAGAVVMMLKGENSSAVIKHVKKRIAEIQESLPEGVLIEPFLDRTKMVNNAIRTVEVNLVEGALIVVFVLVFFLGNLRAGLIVSSVIPLSMLFAIILMNKFGVGGNLMSLGAIDFGIIVDGSVIVVEAILHRFSHSKHFANVSRLSQQDMDNEVQASTGSMIKSAVFSQIIILIVYLPILSLQGIEGKMFKPMAYTISFAILGAFLLSVTYVPMMCALFLSKKIDHTRTIADRIMGRIERIYQPVLAHVLKMKVITLSVTFVLSIMALVVVLNMGGEFIPELEEGDFAVEARVLTGSNLNTTIETTQKASKILLDNFPEVEKVVTKIGSSEIPTDPMPIEASDMMVILKPKDEWTSADNFDDLAAKMEEKISAVPGLMVGFQYPVQMRFNELMTGARQDVVCKIFGENLDTLADYASRLGHIASSVEGATNVYVETVTGMPQVVIRYNRTAMAQFGLNVSDINNVVNTAFAGQSAGLIYEGEQRFDLVVRLAKESRKTISDIRNLLIPASNNHQVPLSQVASVEEIEGPNQVQRENTRRRIIVGFNVTGADVQTVVSELQQKVKTSMKLPAGYSITYGGAFENLNAAKERLAIVVPVALLLIFMMLYFAFNSLKQGLLIYSAIPLSAIGGVFSLAARGMPFSISAGVGFIALFGVAVLNGILLVTEFNRLHKEGWTDNTKLIIHATKTKMRAILMTALVPSLGFIPMAVSRGAGAEVQKPLATVVIGGLLFSMFLTLFVLPVLYKISEDGWREIHFPKTLLVILVLCVFPFISQAQTKITLPEAIDQALKNNGALSITRQNQDYYESLKKSGFDPAPTSFGFEYGQINTAAKDTKYAISQTIFFPTVYHYQNKVSTGNYTLSTYETAAEEIQLRAHVKRVFYELLLLEEKRGLLVQANTLYEQFASRTGQRFRAGDTDAMENAMAQSQQLQIKHQLAMLEAEYKVKQYELKRLLNSTADLQPEADSVLYRGNTVAGTLSTPWIDLQTETVQLSRYQNKLEKSLLLPSISAGYNNVSFVGFQRVGDVDRYFDINDRFTYWSLGLGIPIFNKAQRTRVRASRIMISLNQSRLDETRKRFQMELDTKQEVYGQLKAQAESYRSTLLPNAETIFQSASKRLQTGEINYVEWVMMVNQSISIRSEYLQVIQQLNDVTFSIEQLTEYNQKQD